MTRVAVQRSVNPAQRLPAQLTCLKARAPPRRRLAATRLERTLNETLDAKRMPVMPSHPHVMFGVRARHHPGGNSRWPARMDWAQSVSGLLLGLFMWGHMAFVSSILLGHDAMWIVTKAFEGYFVFGRSVPVLVSFVVAAVAALIVLHAALALRKFPASWRQLNTFGEHRRTLDHGDTTLWWVQVVTGFALFFLAFPHLFQMLMHPGAIGPYESGDRVWSGRWWPLYLLLLFAVELHAGIGLYRLAVKWGWFMGDDPNANRARLKRLKWVLTVFLLALGLATLAAYMKIGRDREGQVPATYTPAWVKQP
jgi:fumarate reductase subunit C